MHKRDYKNFAKGGIYHIFNRGNNKEVVFRDSQDYTSFLFRLGLVIGVDIKSLNNHDLTRCPKSRIRLNSFKSKDFTLHAFCLMPNHFHLLIEQNSEFSISKLISGLTTSFSKYINAKYKRVGHVFQDTFKAVQIETNSQLMLISSYIHMNPVKDIKVNKPEEYMWSSYRDYTIDRKAPMLQTKFLLETFGSKNAFINENIRLYEKIVSKSPFDTLDMWCN